MIARHDWGSESESITRVCHVAIENFQPNLRHLSRRALNPNMMFQISSTCFLTMPSWHRLVLAVHPRATLYNDSRQVNSGVSAKSAAIHQSVIISCAKKQLAGHLLYSTVLLPSLYFIYLLLASAGAYCFCMSTLGLRLRCMLLPFMVTFVLIVSPDCDFYGYSSMLQFHSMVPRRMLRTSYSTIALGSICLPSGVF